MALVTVSRSPPGSGASTPVGPWDQAVQRRSRLQRRQSFAVLRGAVLGLQDGGDNDDAAEASSEPTEKAPSEEELHGDQTDFGQGSQSPQKQEEQRQHLHLMVQLLRPQDDIRLAAQLEAPRPPRLRYLLVVSTREGEGLSQDETVLLGVDFPDSSSPSCTLGLVLPLWSDTQVYLDGDGGFSVTSGGQSRIFKPISIQTMWATLQVLHQACEAALGSGLVPGGSALTWASHYQERLNSEQSCLNEWTAMADLESLRPPSAEPGGSSEQEQMEQAIRAELWKVLDLESTSETSDMPEVFSSHESSHEEPLQPFPQLARTKGGQQVDRGPQPALKSRQSVVTLQGSAVVANRTQAFQEQEQGQGQGQGEPCISSTPRFRKVVRQASVHDSGEEGEA
ncbi:slingshot protein phosphatase 3 [Homo sapiens]|uniref:Slingshot homolog 3 (Drosophila), isoform CRA_e n=1 Tax=Homo sapiens TaxID=9606 RepID=C9JUG3_HUMAN|nr:slingshot homolog 3 (Drosophila), isoform CRA_e [Homo sapiens]KAI2561283.1 slingshot protein phosphatase 3 [Homo sapiens]KAI4072604.1 slingshot protein phosphatase 3 [Homo sapiens]